MVAWVLTMLRQDRQQLGRLSALHTIGRGGFSIFHGGTPDGSTLRLFVSCNLVDEATSGPKLDIRAVNILLRRLDRFLIVVIS
jgi:hypothetical protein